MQSFGVGTTLGSSLAKQHNAIIISERQRTLEKKSKSMKMKLSYFLNKMKLEWPSTGFATSIQPSKLHKNVDTTHLFLILYVLY